MPDTGMVLKTWKPGAGGAWGPNARPKRRRRTRAEFTAGATAPGAAPPPPGVDATPPIVVPQSPYNQIAQILMPYLSPEDSQSLSNYYGFDRTAAPIPGEITGNLRNYYLSKERARSALTTLESMRTAANVSLDSLGPGYTFLTNVIKLLDQFGAQGGEGMSRQAYTQFSTAMDNLFTMAKDNEDIGDPYKQLATMFVQPGFSAGALMPRTKADGTIVYGQASRELFT